MSDSSELNETVEEANPESPSEAGPPSPLSPSTPGGHAVALPGAVRRGPFLLLLAWAALAALLTWLAVGNLEAPGVYFDEALCAHFAKDFLTGGSGHPDLPGRTIDLFGRPFPLYILGYLGALKSWMLLPGFAAFGVSPAVMRLTMLAWTLVGLLLLLLAARRLLGLPAAVLAGLLLALDPSFYFISLCDWGPVVPSYLCRFAGLYFVLRWWDGRRGRDLFLAGLALGLGFFNKIDFAVILAGCGLALAIAGGPWLWRELRRRPAVGSHLSWGVAGFLLGAAPMLWSLPNVVRGLLVGWAAAKPGEAAEKLHTLAATLDGSYFYRLIDQGGAFARMYDTAAPFRSPFGFLAALALAYLAAAAWRSQRQGTPDRVAAFLVLSTALVLLGTWLLPGAVRIHHWTLVYPLPHLALGAAAARLWQRPGGRETAGQAAPRGLRALAAVALAAALGGHLLALHATRRLIAETGGRGLWSNALDRFAAEVRTRRDLTLVSYDWGFYENLALLTDGPKLVDPTWSVLAGEKFAVPTGANVIHLVHPPEYQVFPFNAELLRLARAAGPARVSIRAYPDRQGRPAFYAIHFLDPPPRHSDGLQ